MRVLQVENGSFTPFPFSINGGMGRGGLKFYSRITEMLPQKCDKLTRKHCHGFEGNYHFSLWGRSLRALEVAERLNRTKKNHVHQKLPVMAKQDVPSKGK